MLGYSFQAVRGGYVDDVTQPFNIITEVKIEVIRLEGLSSS